MPENVLKTKIALLEGSKAEWDEKQDYVPKKGEVCLCTYPNGNTFTKVGNGVDAFKDLNWIKAEHGDLMIYVGAVKTTPTDIEGLERMTGIIKQDLIDANKKLSVTIHSEIDPTTGRGLYPAMAIDKRFRLVKWLPPRMPEDWPSYSYETLDKGDYTLYYWTTRIPRDAEYEFLFEVGGQE